MRRDSGAAGRRRRVGVALRAPAAAAAALLAAALFAGGCGSGEPRPAGDTNLLLVTLDTVRADRLGGYGYGAAETPTLDRLAREGVRFAAASSNAPLTLPSHASLLTGLLPPRHGLRNNGAGRLPEVPTLAGVLAAAGYRTAAFVSSFVLDRRFGLDRGFAVYDDAVERDAAGGVALDAERRGDRTVERALAWLAAEGAETLDRRQPFFLWVHLYDAHAPYAPPAPYASRHAGRPYDGEIAFADAQVGRLVAELERRGLAGRTLVAVTADHGEALGEHGELTHGLLLYEPTLRVPLVLRGAGLAAGAVVETPVSLADLGPTLAGLLGRPLAAAAGGSTAGTAAALDGRDLSAALRRGAEPPPADLYAETRYPTLFGWSGLAALRRRQWKYVAAPVPELYDLARDPGERSNLAVPAAVPENSSSEVSAEDPAAAVRSLAERIARVEASAVAPTAAPIDAETRARLESLGYAAPGADPATPATSAAAAGADPKTRIALFRRYEEANGALREGRARQAQAALQELVEADPGNPVFRGKLAQALREGGDLAAAVPLLRQAVATAPHDSEAWYNLGVALQEAAEWGEARQVLSEAARLDPARPEAHNLLGVVALQEGRQEDAARAFERALALDPDDARTHNNHGNVLRGLGRFDDAERAYRRAAELAPAYAEPWNGLGTLAVERDRPADALPFFDHALTLAPGYHEVRLNRAIACELAGRTAEAIAAYRGFLAAAAEDPQFSEQRRAAEQLLARLSDRESGVAPEERR